MGLDGTKLDGMVWGGMGREGKGYDVKDGMGLDGTKLDGMVWGGMGREEKG